MSTNGQLVFTDVDKITFKGVGNTSNAVVDTVTGKIGVGIDSPDANLHVLGNSYVSTNLELGGTLIMGTVNVSAHHSLEAVTAEGNTTPLTIEFSNATTGIVTTGNVEVGKDLVVSGNVEVGTANLFVDTTTGNVGVGTTSPQGQLHISSGTSGDCVMILQADTDNSYEGDNPRIEFWQDGSLRESAIVQGDNTLNIMNSVSSDAGIVFHTGTTNGYTNAVERMRIDASGNAGIGTSAPNKKLHIYTTGSESNTQLALESADRYATMQMSDNSGGVLVQNDQGDLRLLTGYDASMTGGSEAMRIKGNGNVGIGTPSPVTYLHLSAKNSNPGATEGDSVGTHDLTEYLRFTSTFDGGDVNAVSVGFKLGADDNSTVSPDGRLDICANNGGVAGNSYGNTPDRTIATFIGSGNVGIGTTSPNWILEISDGNDSITHYGPNTTWGGRLSVGAANDKTAANDSATAQCISTNGNLHLDAADTRDIYLCHYRGTNVRFGSAIIHSSDDRLKSEEELITNATDTLLKLSPQKYKKAYTLREDESREPFTESGLMAQDVWYDAPELRHLVHLGSDANPTDTKPEAPVEGDIRQDPDYSSWGTETAALNYDGLIAYLIKSNQELHTRIKALENAS